MVWYALEFVKNGSGLSFIRLAQMIPSTKVERFHQFPIYGAQNYGFGVDVYCSIRFYPIYGMEQILFETSVDTPLSC